MDVGLSRDQYIDYIKLLVTGGLLELEIGDDIIGKFVDAALVELQRHIDETTLITVPYASCIDLGPYIDASGVALPGFKHSSIKNIYRTEGFNGDGGSEYGQGSQVDPMYALRWMIYSSGNMYNLNNYIYNYLSYNTLTQLRTTMGTDLDWKEDKHNNKLYVTASVDRPKYITIEYIPVFDDVEKIKSDYWIDILKQLSLALTKVALGRIRTRFTQTNALWTQDGETMLSEGNEELKTLRENLRVNANLFLVAD